MSGAFDTPELGELYRTVEMGLDAEQFKRSPVGLYLLRRVAEERTDALADLVDVAPNDAEAVRALQSVIKRCDSFEFWIEDAIAAGRNAEAQLDPRDTNE